MYLFIIGIVFALAGGIMNIKGTSRLKYPSGGLGRISRKVQVRLDESVQKMPCVEQAYDQYLNRSNAFEPNIPGLIILFLGVVLIALSYFLHI